MKLQLVALCLLLCATSCSFNNSFYQGEKIPSTARRVVMTDVSGGAPIKMILNIGGNFQPSFTDTLNNPLPLSYSIESVIFKNDRGNKLNGWFIRNKSVAPVASILLLHGNGGNILSHYPAAVQLVREGFQVFIIDYSGYGFSEGRSTRENILKDADSAFSYFVSRPDVAGTRVVIYGQSLGGHLAATVARDNEKRIDALVMEGAFSSHKDVAAHMFRAIAPLARILVREKYSAVQSVHYFHKPILIIHSTEDEVIPYRMGRKVYDHANQPKSFYEIKHRHMSGPMYYADSITYKIKSMLGI